MKTSKKKIQPIFLSAVSFLVNSYLSKLQDSRGALGKYSPRSKFKNAEVKHKQKGRIRI